jgi:hypothetical protein
VNRSNFWPHVRPPWSSWLTLGAASPVPDREVAGGQAHGRLSLKDATMSTRRSPRREQPVHRPSLGVGEASPYRGGRTLAWLKVRQRDYRVEMNHRSTIPSEPRDEAHHHTWGRGRNPKTAAHHDHCAQRGAERLLLCLLSGKGAKGNLRSNGRFSGTSSDSRGIRPDRADGPEGERRGVARPGGGVAAVGRAQVARPGARGVSRVGSSRPRRARGSLTSVRGRRKCVHIENPG